MGGDGRGAFPQESWPQEGALEVVGEMKGIGKVEAEGEEKEARTKQKREGRKKGKGSRERQGRRNRRKIKIGGYMKAIFSPNFNYFTFSKILCVSMHYFK